MKRLSMLFLMVCMAHATISHAQTNSNPFNGTWVPIREEIGGASLPAASFAKQKLIILDNTYAFTAESVDKGELTWNNGKMDIYGKEGVNTGRHFTTIYKYENGELTICYNLKGDNYPESFDTKGKPFFFLCVFKKEEMKP